jgi:pyrimidine operon attenuation protein / uracil phosphoribosyltransferase
MSTTTYILTRAVAAKKIERMALEVAERNYNVPELVLIGIRENGIIIADKLAAALQSVFTGRVKVLSLSLDKKQPGDIVLSPETNVDQAHLLLIDDVANSGRTMLYALKPLLKFYPTRIQTLALVERTHKNFPINIDYVGLSVSTTPDQHIYVEVADGEVLGAYMT